MKKFFLAPVLVLAAFTLTVAHPVLAQGSGQIEIKDQAEFSAYQTAITATTPQAKATASEAFLTQYPQSVVKNAVLEGLVDAYAQFDQAKTVDAATRLLQVEPNNLKALYLIAAIKKGMAGQAAQAAEAAKQAAQQSTDPATKASKTAEAATDAAKQSQLLDDAAAMATKGLAATKPAEVKDEDWTKQKAATDPVFYSILSADALYSKKDLPGAITAFRTELEYLAKNNPAATSTVGSPGLNDTLLLGQTYTQLTPPDMVNGVWFLARAENFAPAGYKPVIDQQAKYWYKRFHGKPDGFDAVLAQAATTIFPPPDFKIEPAPTPKDIADNVVATTADLTTLAIEDKEYVLANASPANAEKLWALLKGQFTEINGVVIAATATQIQVAVTDDAKTDKKADFTVNLKTPLADKDIPAVGSTTKTDTATETSVLIGAYDSYTQNPAQIIMANGEFQVTKKKVAPHKPAAGHHPAH